MHKQGLINKKADTRRKNIIRLSLTKKGREAYKHSIEFQSFLPIIAVMPDKKSKQLWDLLQIIRLEVFKDLHIDVNAYSSILNEPLIIDAVIEGTKEK